MKSTETALAAASSGESGIVDWEEASMGKSRDQDRGKGAMEQDQQNQAGILTCKAIWAP